MTRVSPLVFLFAGLAAAAERVPGADRDKVLAEARGLNDAGVQLFKQGKYPEARAKLERAVELYEKLFPASQYPNSDAGMALALLNLGDVWRTSGQPAESLPYFERALASYRKLYPPRDHPVGHPDLARCIARLGSVRYATGQYTRALPLLEESLEMRRKLYPSDKYPAGNADLTASVNNLAALLVAMGRPAQAIPYLEEVLAAKERLYPPEKYPQGHEDLAFRLHNLAAAMMAAGRYLDALPHLERALEMNRRLFPVEQFPNGHKQWAYSVHGMGNVLRALNEPEKALPYCEQALAMNRKLYPVERFPAGHPDIARALQDLSESWRALTQFDRALAYAEQALVMRETLYPSEKYPEGHPDLAASCNAVGALLQLTGRAEKAMALHERSLALFEGLYPPAKYPNGHGRLAAALSNLSVALQETGRPADALPYAERALAMLEKLYPPTRFPDGDPGIATDLSNLSVLLYRLERNEEALRRADECLAMRRKLYPASRFPEGHPDLAKILMNAGALRVLVGRPTEALPLLEEGLVSSVKHLHQIAAVLPEADAFALTTELLQGRDALLFASRDGDPDRAYRVVWQTKAVLTRVLQTRRAALRAAQHRSADVRQQMDELFRVRSQIARTLFAPEDTDRTGYLEKLLARRDRLERTLAEALPGLAREQEFERSGPAGLAAALPARSVFVDFIRYGRSNEDGTFEAAYAAFVVAEGQPVRRVEFKSAKAIDADVTAWREAIATGTETTHASQLTQSVWEPIARQLPAGTTTVYLAPDGDLARLPWSALRVGRTGRVLLEDLALAVVPHGPFLLAQLKTPMPSRLGPEAMLLLGGLNYDAPGTPTTGASYPFLKGSVEEVRAIEQMRGARRTVLLDGVKATPQTVRKALKDAQVAHLATHGFFAEAELSAARRREEKAREQWRLPTDRPGDGIGTVTRSPLSYTGLVLSQANRRDGAGEAILSGEAIAGLPLENLRLCVLSACETGLGDLTGGEGVQGLQLAFHLAGCPNVTASLWKVNDTATAALMAQFYHELWINKKPPIEALREAQLTIFRHPERINDLAGERGRPALDAAARLGSTGMTKPEEKPKTAPTKLWAAFVLSGVGK